MREREIFDAALAITDLAERSAYLAEVCAICGDQRPVPLGIPLLDGATSDRATCDIEIACRVHGDGRGAACGDYRPVPLGIPFQNSSLGYDWGGPFNYVTATYLHSADLAYYVGGAVAFLIYWFGARAALRRA